MISLNTLLKEELEQLSNSSQPENLDEGFFTNLFAGLGLMIGTSFSLTIGGANVLKLDAKQRASIQKADKTEFGNKLKDATPQVVNSVYQKLVQNNKDYKIAVQKHDANKANLDKLSKATEDAKRLAILKAYSEDKNSFVIKGNTIQYDTTKRLANTNKADDKAESQPKV
jgi:hypothetical protein